MLSDLVAVSLKEVLQAGRSELTGTKEAIRKILAADEDLELCNIVQHRKLLCDIAPELAIEAVGLKKRAKREVNNQGRAVSSSLCLPLQLLLIAEFLSQGLGCRNNKAIKHDSHR